MLAFDSSASQSLDEQQQTALVALVAALAGTDEVAGVMTQEAYFDIIEFGVEDDVGLLDLQLLIPVLSLLPTHLDY